MNTDTAQDIETCYLKACLDALRAHEAKKDATDAHALATRIYEEHPEIITNLIQLIARPWIDSGSVREEKLDQAIAPDRQTTTADADKVVITGQSVLSALGEHYGSYDIDLISSLAASLTSANYATRYMKTAQRFQNAHDLLTFSAKQVTGAGLFLEFGVFSGRSINLLGELLPDQRIFGFDSFEGLPEDWLDFTRGTFAVPEMPPVLPNITLVKGWFDRTIPFFLDEHENDPVAFLHVDCDLYSSTQTIFHHLRDRIVPGTIIVFDEYFNYSEWLEHEHLAFKQFVDLNHRAYEYIGFVPRHQQVAVRMVK